MPQAGPSKAGGRDSTPGSGPKLTAAKLASLKKRYVGVPQDPIKKSRPCPVCKEVFKPEWAEEHEEWVYWNAVDINGTVSTLCRPDHLAREAELMIDISRNLQGRTDVVDEIDEGRREKE